MEYQRYGSYGRSLQKNTSPSLKPSLKQAQHGKRRIPVEYIVGGLLVLSVLPIWRSGLKDNLNFWQFLLNHTIWGDPVEFIPKEMYSEIIQ